jgi:hypothetical protein
MQQFTSSSLFQTLATLTDRAEQLSAQLSKAAKRLHEAGDIPNEELLEAVTEFRRTFFTLRDQGLTTAESLATPSCPPSGAPTSLHDLKALVQSIAQEEERKTRYGEVAKQALAVLDRVLLIQHREQPVFPPLQDCQEQARTIREAIAEACWPNMHPSLESLAKGEDPFSDFLSWVEQKDSLDDEAWALLQETVEQTFGKALAIAASRGKLFLPTSISLQQDFMPIQSPHAVTTGGLQTALDLYSSPHNAREEAENAVLPVTSPSEVDEILISNDNEEKTTLEALTNTELGKEYDSLTYGMQTSLDVVSLGSLYSFALEDSAQHIAATIVLQDSATRAASLRDLTWRLLAEDKGAQAFHLASYLEARHPQIPHRLPSWLLRALILGRHVRHAAGEAARFLEEDLSHFSPSLYPPAQQEWNQALSFLLAAATLQPALLAPHTQAPVVLRSLRWEMPLPQLAMYCKSIADYGVRQYPLDPNLLKKGKEQVAWQAEMDVIKQAVELWWARAPRLSFTFTPATKVWQKWLEPKNTITSLLSPIRYNDTSKLTAVQRTVELLSDEDQLKREIEHTDHSVLGRQLGNEINGRSLEQLLMYTREAVGFARRWIELQEIHSGQRRGPIHVQAERLRQTVRDLHGAAQEELRLLKRKHPSPLILSGVACCRRAMDNLQLLFDPEAAFPTEEPLPRPLLYADLLRIPSVSLNDKWEIEGSGWEALVDGILDLVTNSTQKKTVL